jgi:hypothetical protein
VSTVELIGVKRLAPDTNTHADIQLGLLQLGLHRLQLTRRAGLLPRQMVTRVRSWHQPVDGAAQTAAGDRMGKTGTTQGAVVRLVE